MFRNVRSNYLHFYRYRPTVTIPRQRNKHLIDLYNRRSDTNHSTVLAAQCRFATAHIPEHPSQSPGKT